ncbi:NADPH:quinone reductase [Desulfogranum japonicum]|uniref:NADPH:quinone reductase n=1 Tax=Desulfogranum japonicum TaxID=231447 RepID=UPI00040CF1AC|nr:NADPH:quinone reductase [Desulfogranum japonicum]
MKAIQVSKFGQPEVLQYTDIDRPTPAIDEVLIKVKAIGVNPVDTYIRSGKYPVLPSLPYIPGSDVAGIIEQCGSQEPSFTCGTRVYTCGTISGGYAQRVTAKTSQVFHLPDGISFQEGASLGVPATTAWRALFIRGCAQAGEKVFIHGASSSVGMCAVQMARAAGLKVYGTAGTKAGIDRLKSLGISGVWNHREQEYLSTLQKELQNNRFNLILEMLANVNLSRDMELLAPRGRVVVIGSRGTITFDPRSTMGPELDIRGLSLFNSTGEELKQAQAGIQAALTTGTLKPVIARVFSLEDACKAHQQVMANGKCGKILLTP